MSLINTSKKCMEIYGLSLNYGIVDSSCGPRQIFSLLFFCYNGCNKCHTCTCSYSAGLECILDSLYAISNDLYYSI